MFPASKLDDLFRELKTKYPHYVIPVIESRNATVTSLSQPELPNQITWQQKDLFIFFHWLPAGHYSVSSNLSPEYLKDRSVDYYVNLANASLDTNSAGNQLIAVYLTLAAIKNLLLLHQLLHDIENDKDSPGTLRNGQLRECAKIHHSVDKITRIAAVACKRMKHLDTEVDGDVIYKEIIDQLTKLDNSMRDILTLRKTEGSTPTPSPASAQSATLVLTPPPLSLPSMFQPSSHKDDDIKEEEEVEEDDTECEMRATSWCVLFSNCLPSFTQAPQEKEMQEMTVPLMGSASTSSMM